MEPIVSKSLPVSLNQHRSHGPIFIIVRTFVFPDVVSDITLASTTIKTMYPTTEWCLILGASTCKQTKKRTLSNLPQLSFLEPILYTVKVLCRM